ncbi:DUF6082 family protein [Paractinoplanes lichenicola]|uniref:DUF4760 domain-containing protein n=1 Tax=Paractinoplanes lichenicola TaxID=2802976 RepID=A0ABS1VU13_9ACTN|nr:DUF6082 family protein [Actinoplanes lichenicola]MBL7257955.1 hypothetical protein [Actinoplanes lichenicola]
MRTRKTRLVALIVIPVALAVILISPLFFWLLLHRDGTSWSELADIGETYGAASAILSALAVAGVAAGLLFQSQQLRLSRLHHVRSVQRELMMKLVDRPDIAEAINYFGNTTADRGRRAFIVSLFHYAYLTYEAGLAPMANLTNEVFPALFGSEEIRHFWHDHRLAWLEPDGDAGMREFALLADEFWRKTQAEEDVAPQSSTRDAMRSITPLAGILTAGAVVTGLGWWLGRRRAAANVTPPSYEPKRCRR